MPRTVQPLSASQRRALASEALRALVSGTPETSEEVLNQRLSTLRSSSDRPLRERAQAAYLIKVVANCCAGGTRALESVEVVVAGRPSDPDRRVFARNTSGEDGRLLDLYTREVSHVTPIPVQKED